ncbi:Fumarate hydratase class I, alpha region [Candidatus Syntrophocurvum alkaliphilum]|uniref:Fumarate hydratase class I, alpha region n=1 Tax=Candidatus Syntrophocurvum alkaliphilum TaxID=2293317 RepID=A0A6I6DC01_9FIRM|nr:fumarate hydratase [Candidatus Syntrophocurvum alkaliphilum]QGT98875.1 Fumarate hydratase class I, alpha region [Candidatus Syntrophocurvum alkaliphilum]
MRQISVKKIQEAVTQAVGQVNIYLPRDIEEALNKSLFNEENERAKNILNILLENAKIAREEKMALCQDTGMVAVDIELGQQVIISDGDILSAVNQGISDGYEKYYLRKSVVSCPFERKNTGDNTPAIINISLFPDDRLVLNIMPKGAGSENMGQLAMLKPAEGIQGVKDFVINVVKNASSNPCPPIIVGVGIGGNMEKAAHLAKKALFRDINTKNNNKEIAVLEQELLSSINALDIGPQGFGGKTTALAVNAETYPTHIASLPVAVNIGCHCMRRIRLAF